MNTTWTKEEINIIIENYNKCTYREILKIINNTINNNRTYTQLKGKIEWLCKKNKIESKRPKKLGVDKEKSKEIINNILSYPENIKYGIKITAEKYNLNETSLRNWYYSNYNKCNIPNFALLSKNTIIVNKKNVTKDSIKKREEINNNISKYIEWMIKQLQNNTVYTINY